MNNKENYKKAIEEIHAPEELKNKTFEKIMTKKKSKINVFFKYALAVAVFIICIVGVNSINLEKPNNTNLADNGDNIQKTQVELPRFASMDELREVLKQNNSSKFRTYNEATLAVTDTAVKSETQSESINNLSNHSETNIQVENVDEADIVKTDGDFIYYISNYNIYILKNDLELVSTITYDNSQTEIFSPRELYINGDKLIILGNYSCYEEDTATNSIMEDTTTDIAIDYVSVQGKEIAKAIVYNIESRENPYIEREVGLDGYYINSRMIDDNIYFISNKNNIYYTDMLKDSDILPYTQDSTREEENKIIECTDIAYFKNSNTYNYMIVGAFNINNTNEVNTETFFGASDNVYASEENLYVTQLKIDGNSDKTIIYKFNLEKENIILQGETEVKGYLNNQFSMDEYEGNLRVATTIAENETIENIEDDGTVIMGTTQNLSNNLIILDENLEEIGKIENLAPDEEIYAVRFIGKIGYIVTFEQIDPLFTIDLSDPRNPVVKGELKIPGYSSYLHPYDDTHIIGIGYNTKETANGGVTNTNMKISMFDVSDLENPKEMFTIDAGEEYTYSELEYNHKALFTNKSKDLIGFPLSYNSKNAFVIFKINLDSGFEKYGEIVQDVNYMTNINRGIYIEDTLYTLSESQIVSYDLNSMEKQKTLEFE